MKSILLLIDDADTITQTQLSDTIMRNTPFYISRV